LILRLTRVLPAQSDMNLSSWAFVAGDERRANAYRAGVGCIGNEVTGQHPGCGEMIVFTILVDERDRNRAAGGDIILICKPGNELLGLPAHEAPGVLRETTEPSLGTGNVPALRENDVVVNRAQDGISHEFHGLAAVAKNVPSIVDASRAASLHQLNPVRREATSRGRWCGPSGGESHSKSENGVEKRHWAVERVECGG